MFNGILTSLPLTEPSLYPCSYMVCPSGITIGVAQGKLSVILTNRRKSKHKQKHPAIDTESRVAIEGFLHTVGHCIMKQTDPHHFFPSTLESSLMSDIHGIRALSSYVFMKETCAYQTISHRSKTTIKYGNSEVKSC